MPFRIIAFRGIALIGLAFSAALVADEVIQSPTFCSFASGCAEVTSSFLGQPLGIPLPIVGVLAFGSFFFLTLFPKTQRRLLGRLALAAGIAGIFLAVVQLLILRQICRFCFVVDAAAILLLAVELRFPGKSEDLASRNQGRRWIWMTAALGAVLLPLGWAALRPPPEVPPEVQKTWQAGKINIVEITSFTCPYCRETHRELVRLEKQYRDRLNFVRFVATSPENDEGVIAARLYLCALRQNRGEEMAHPLFSLEDYSIERVREVAVIAGLDLEQFNRDWIDTTLDEEIESTHQWATGLEISGVPQIWVQDILLVGGQSYDQLLAAVRRAVARESR